VSTADHALQDHASTTMSAEDDSFPIDLCKVNYDDVLHLYRGWRRSENALKEKKIDFDLLLVKTEQLQESHKRFRDQIQFLESVKDVATRLQSELSAMQKENKLLLNENRKLSAAKSSLDTESKRLSSDVIAYKEANRKYETQVALLTKNCEEAVTNQKALEVKLSDEAVARTTAENRMASNDGLIEQLRTESSFQRTESNENAARIAQCGEELRLASKHITLLTEEVARNKVTKDQLSAAEAEVGILKGDISRLLRLLDHYPASEGFLNRWYASDGMSFLGMGVPKRKKAPSVGDSIETDSDIGEFLFLFFFLICVL
jgi:chromosome segregation ATPase